MGFRANVVVQDREYGDQTFGSWTDFTSKFVPEIQERGYELFSSNENEDFFEIEKHKLQEFVDSLPRDDKASIYPLLTNEELKENLQAAINQSRGEMVSWEWF